MYENHMPRPSESDVTGFAKCAAAMTTIWGSSLLIVVYFALQLFGVAFNFYHGIFVVLGVAALVWIVVFTKETASLQRKAAAEQDQRSLELETLPDPS